MIILQAHGRRLPSVLMSVIRPDLMPNRAFQSGASDDPTASHDERCILRSHAITIARGCRRNRNRHRYRLPRRLQPQPVEWLWQHRLAAGTLAMLSGEPGSGKTWVALAIAAALTRGRDPFTGEKLKPATVLYASAEHPAAQVIQPRFAGLHGDPARLVILRRAVSASSMSSPDSALRDLEHALQKTQAHLVILDPWDGLWEVDLDRASQTRPLLDRLARLAELSPLLHPPHSPPRQTYRRQACPSRSGIHRLLRRSPYRVSRRQLPRRTRANRSAARQIEPWTLAPPLDYRIGEDGDFHWTGSAISPRRISSPPVPPAAGLPKRKFAAQWLRDCLQPGSPDPGSIEKPPSAMVLHRTLAPPANSISAFVAPRTENRVPGGGLCASGGLVSSGQRGKMLKLIT